MRKCIKAPLCALVVLVSLSAAHAANVGLQSPDSGVQSPEWYALVNSDSAALYSGMSLNASTIQRMTKGSIVKVDLEFTGEAGHWFKVSTEEPVAAVGYVKAEDVSVQSPAETIAWEYRPPPDPSPEGPAGSDRLKAAKKALVTRAEIEKEVRGFFVSRFRHGAPISADGQTMLHSRMGFDHSNSVDVAVSPDSPEGQAFMNHLRGMGIPFIAFRRAVPGSATGAHIHVGIPSRRVRNLR